jgi:hypothetical protein
MNTEQQPNVDRQAEHARRYKAVIDLMAMQAGQLTRLEGEPKLDFMDVANAYATTAANILLTEIGPAAAVAHLREIAATIEAGAPVAN